MFDLEDLTAHAVGKQTKEERILELELEVASIKEKMQQLWDYTQKSREPFEREDIWQL